MVLTAVYHKRSICNDFFFNFQDSYKIELKSFGGITSEIQKSNNDGDGNISKTKTKVKTKFRPKGS